MAKIEIAYWNIRGLVEPAIMMLEYGGADYTFTKYSFNETPGCSNWPEHKFKLGLQFPNLPYYTEGDFKLSQSNAIFRHLGRKFNLYGDGSIQQASEIDMLIDCVMDIRNAYTRLCYAPTFETDKPTYLENAKKSLALFEDVLTKRKFLIGETLSVPDFHFWTMLDCNECLEGIILDGFPNLKRFKKDFEALPQISAYLSSEKFKKYPINNCMASFGWEEKA